MPTEPTGPTAYTANLPHDAAKPYLTGRQVRMPLRRPLAPLTKEQLDRLANSCRPSPDRTLHDCFTY